MKKILIVFLSSLCLGALFSCSALKQNNFNVADVQAGIDYSKENISPFSHDNGKL